MEANHAVNNEEYYYYDSHYYFSWNESTKSKNKGRINISESKRIQDGRYYVTCTFAGKEVYVIAGIEENDGGRYWNIYSMSLTPVFDQLGIMLKTDEEARDYEMRSLVIEGAADDGTVFRKYVIKYPYFYGESQGELEANSFYQNIITFYQQQAQQVQSDYKKFVKQGGKTESLPIELHYTAQVSYTDAEKLCLINEIVESLPLYNEETKTTENLSQTETQSPVDLAEKTIECYTFDMETGLYVSKDTIVGKDYHKVAEILYRIHGGYAYDDLLGGETATQDIPKDEKDFGEKIYNSASTLCEDGYVFCYVTDDGIREDVVIPLEVLSKLTEVSE